MPVKGSPPPHLGDNRDFATRFDYVHFNSVKGSLVEHLAQGREAWQGEQAGDWGVVAHFVSTRVAPRLQK